MLPLRGSVLGSVQVIFILITVIYQQQARTIVHNQITLCRKNCGMVQWKQWAYSTGTSSVRKNKLRPPAQWWKRSNGIGPSRISQGRTEACFVVVTESATMSTTESLRKRRKLATIAGLSVFDEMTKSRNEMTKRNDEIKWRNETYINLCHRVK